MSQYKQCILKLSRYLDFEHRLYTTGECYAYPIENDLLINKPFSWEKLQIPETGANSVKALI